MLTRAIKTYNNMKRTIYKTHRQTHSFFPSRSFLLLSSLLFLLFLPKPHCIPPLHYVYLLLSLPYIYFPLRCCSSTLCFSSSSFFFLVLDAFFFLLSISSLFSSFFFLTLVAFFPFYLYRFFLPLPPIAL